MNKNLLKGLVALLIAISFLLPGAVLVAGDGGADGEQARAESFESDELANEMFRNPKLVGDLGDLQPCSWQEQGGKHVAKGKDFTAVFTSPEDMVIYTGTTSVTISCKPPTWTWTSTINSDTVTYSNSPNKVDVEYKITENSIKETIILNQATSRNWFFKYSMANLAGWEYDGHHIRMWKIENDLATEYIIPKENAWDSAGNTCEVAYECEQDPDNANAFSVKLVLSNMFLKSAIYPVYIDPTLNIHANYFPTQRQPAFSNMGSDLQVTFRDFVNIDTNSRPFIQRHYGAPIFRTLEINYTHVNEEGLFGELGPTGAFAQCFNATSNFTLTGVALQLRGKTNNYDYLEVWLASDDNGFPNNTTAGRLTNIVHQDWPIHETNWFWMDVIFDKPVNIVNGSRYWIVLNCTGPDVGYEFYCNRTNTYSDGYSAQQTKSTGVWNNTDIEDCDMNFRVYRKATEVLDNALPVGNNLLKAASYKDGDSARILLDIETPMLPKSEQLLAYVLDAKYSGSGNSIQEDTGRNLILIALYDESGAKLNEFEYVIDAVNNTNIQTFESSSIMRINLSAPSKTDFTEYFRNLRADIKSLGLDFDAFSYFKLRIYHHSGRHATDAYLFNYIAIGNTLDTKLASIAPADRLLLQGQTDYTGFYLTPLSNQTAYYKLKFENITITNLTVDDVAIEPVAGLYNITGVSGDTQGIEIRTKQTSLGDLRYDLKVSLYNSTGGLIGTEHFKIPSDHIGAISVKDSREYIISECRGKKYFGGDLELFIKNNMTMNHTATYVLKYQGVEIWRNETNLTNDNATTRQVKKYVALAREGLYSLETTFAFVEYGKNRTYSLEKEISLGKKADVSKTDLPLELWEIKGNSLLSFALTVYNNNTLYADESVNATYYIVVNNNGTVTAMKWENLAEGLNTKTLSLYTPGTGYGNAFVDIKVYKKLNIAKLAVIYPEASKVNLTAAYGITGSDVFGFLLYSQNTTINEKAKPLAAVGWAEQASEWFTAYWMYVAAGIAALAVIAILYAAASKPRYRRRR